MIDDATAACSNITALTLGPFGLGNGRLSVDGDPTFEEWESAVASLSWTEKNVQWWLGDLLAYGETRWGEQYAQASAAMGEAEANSLRVYQWVAEHVLPETRHPDLSWTHHREVASLPQSEQTSLLSRAARDGLSTRELHEAVGGKRFDLDGGAGPTLTELSKLAVGWGLEQAVLVVVRDGFVNVLTWGSTASLSTRAEEVGELTRAAILGEVLQEVPA